MKKKTRIIALLIVVVLSMSLLGGCNPNDSKSATTTTTTPSSTDNNSPIGTGKPSEKPNTVKVMVYQTCPTLDRYGDHSGMAGPVQVLWGDSLIWLDENNKYQPWLATWETSDDYREWTFHLRDNVYFHNGNKLTAEDVAFTYNRNIENPTAINDPISGVVERVEVIDPLTVKFYFKNVHPGVYECLYGYSIINKAAYEANPEHYYDLPIGTGPYEITYYDPIDSKMSFKKAPSWWGWEVLGFESNVDIIEFEYVSEEATRINALRAGDVQVIDNISPSNFQTITNNKLSYGVWDTMGMGLMMLNMNPGTVFNNDSDLCKALSLCVDRESIVQNIRGGAGSVMDYPVQKGWVCYKAGTDVYKYDPKLAAELVSKSKYDGRKLKLVYRSSGESETVQAIQAFASAVGINIEIQLLEKAAYSDVLIAGNYDIAFREWSGSCGENTKFFYEFLGQDLFNNGYGKINPEFAELALSLQIINDPDEIKRVRTQLFESMAENYAPHIYLYTQFFTGAYSPNISGIRYYGAFNNLDYRRMVIE